MYTPLAEEALLHLQSEIQIFWYSNWIIYCYLVLFNIPRWNNMTAYFTFLHPRDFQYRYLRYFFPRRWMRLRVWHIWQRCWMRTALRKIILYSCICHLWWSWNMSVDCRFWRLHTHYSYLGTTSSWLIFLLNQQIGILKNVDMSFMGNGNIFDLQLGSNGQKVYVRV